MSYSWQELTTDQVQFYRLGVDEAVAKQFDHELDLVRELYYARRVHEQPWATGGFLKPLGYHYDRPVASEQGTYLVFYPVAPSLPDEEPDEGSASNLAYAVYWLAKSGLYLRSITTDQLRLVDGQIVAAGYPFDEQAQPGESAEEITEKLLNLVNFPLTYSLVESVKKRTPRPRPSLVSSFQEFYDQFQSIRQHEPPTLLGTGGYGCVYSPPINCQVKLSGRFVGKVFKFYGSEESDDTIESETRGAELMAQIDPTGEFHTRLIDQCLIEPPTDCEFEVEQTGYVPELVYEHGGTSIDDVIPTIVGDPVRRLWFYIGLERFLGQLEYMVAKEVLHMDARSVNVVVDSTYRFRLIDFGFVRPFSEFGGVGTVYYPREEVLADPIPYRPNYMTLWGWDRALNTTRRVGAREYDVVMELNGMTEKTAHSRIEEYLSQVYMMTPTEQRRWVIEHVDSHTFGMTLAAQLKKQAEEMFDELKPTLYHLVAYDVNDRSIGLARYQLKKLIESLPF